jgi:thiol:disulfide interchange protein DsbD
MFKLPHFLAGMLVFFTLLAVSVRASPLLPVKVEFARNGEQAIAAVIVDIPPEYHAYAHESGDSGRPTLLAFSFPDHRFLPVFYPVGALQRDYYNPNSTVFVYEGRTTFFISMSSNKTGLPFTLDVNLLLCSAKNCLPVNQHSGGVVPSALPDMENMSWRGQWREIESANRLVTNFAPSNEEHNTTVEAQKSLPGQNKNSAEKNRTRQLTPKYADTSLEIYGLGKALLMGILAGLLLNVMPCVLPVLVLKVNGFLMTGTNGKEGLRRLREHNLCFAAGVMTLFTALALILWLADLMWGQLYQNQAVLLVLLLVVFLMGLSMLDVFTLPVIDFKFSSKLRKPRLQFYLTGLLSTFLATPCSGPLLGGVLGWAFTQSLPVLIVVFWSVGLGMSLPYILLCIWPKILQILPQPGHWMLLFERVVGFFLLGTTLYLLSILPASKYLQVLSALLLLAFCAWLWGRYCGVATSVRCRVAGIICFVILTVSTFIILQPVPPLPRWSEFTPEYFSAQVGKKNILLEFTADWCPNCKLLEATILTDERLRKWQRSYNMEFIRVDITKDDSCATRLLAELGGKSIPLTALFPVGEDATSPLVMRDVYSMQHIEKNMDEFFQKRTDPNR